jgi:paraquat-inducible protein A
MSALISCEFCDQLHRHHALARGQTAKCTRCGGKLYGSTVDSLERTLAYSFAAFILFWIANLSTFMEVSMGGQTQSNTILAGVLGLWDFGYYALGALILFTTILAPLLKLLLTLYAVGPVLIGLRLPGVVFAMRSAEWLATWSMLEVYLLAVIVAVVKLAMMATVNLEIGSYAFFIFIGASTLANASLETEAVWDRLSGEKGTT